MKLEYQENMKYLIDEQKVTFKEFNSALKKEILENIDDKFNEFLDAQNEDIVINFVRYKFSFIFKQTDLHGYNESLVDFVNDELEYYNQKLSFDYDQKNSTILQVKLNDKLLSVELIEDKLCWVFENCIVHTWYLDYDLRYFDVYNKDDKLLGYIYPSTISDVWGLIDLLNSGSNPIDDAWEDGLGNTCNENGWVKYNGS